MYAACTFTIKHFPINCRCAPSNFKESSGDIPLHPKSGRKKRTRLEARLYYELRQTKDTLDERQRRCKELERALSNNELDERIIGTIVPYEQFQKELTAQQTEHDTSDKGLDPGRLVDTAEKNTVIQSKDTGVEITVVQSKKAGVENTVDQSKGTGVENTVDQSKSTGVENTVDQSKGTGVENTVDQSKGTWVENTVDHSKSTGVENIVNQSKGTGVENTVHQSKGTGVENTVDQSKSTGVENNVDQSNDTMVENTVNQFKDKRTENINKTTKHTGIENATKISNSIVIENTIAQSTDKQTEDTVKQSKVTSSNQSEANTVDQSEDPGGENTANHSEERGIQITGEQSKEKKIENSVDHSTEQEAERSGNQLKEGNMKTPFRQKSNEDANESIISNIMNAKDHPSSIPIDALPEVDKVNRLHNSSAQDAACTLMQKEGISPNEAPKMFKQITLYQSFVGNLRLMPKSKRTEVLKEISSPAELKELRVTSQLGKDVNLDRRSLVKLKKRGKSKRVGKYVKRSKLIVDFLKRPENSICLPGKKDTVTIKKKKLQKYVLIEFLHVLHTKFNKEFPEHAVSLDFFRKVRRQAHYIKVVACNNTEVCLCMRHQNFTLKLRALRGLGLPLLPDSFVRLGDEEINEKLNNCPELVSYQHWKRKDVTFTDRNNNERTSRKFRIEQVSESREKFVSQLIADVPLMRDHVHRVYSQHTAIRVLRTTLPSNHCTIQMDFAENWLVSYPQEPQSVYFGKDPVTLHPAIVHYPGGVHESFALVTDHRFHDAKTVFCFLKKLIPLISEIHPDLEFVHYITDSPTSQYRNSAIFSVVCKHQELFGVKASWSYFEAGHGKGPCDGIGGAAKRQADNAVKRQILIEGAADFAKVGNDGAGDIQYIYVNNQEIKEGLNQFPSIICGKRVVGTMKAHMVVCTIPGQSIAIRSTSCYGDCCFDKNKWVLSCNGWTHHNLFKDNPEVVDENNNFVEHKEPSEEIHQAECTDDQEGQVVVGDWVAAVYDDTWYIGKVLRIEPNDEGDLDYEITFMHRTMTSTPKFKWPTPKPDITPVAKEDILLKIPEPTATGTGRRKIYFILPDTSISAVESAFATF